jgi:hypothetical protein
LPAIVQGGFDLAGIADARTRFGLSVYVAPEFPSCNFCSPEHRDGRNWRFDHKGLKWLLRLRAASGGYQAEAF